MKNAPREIRMLQAQFFNSSLNGYCRQLQQPYSFFFLG